MKTAAPAPPVDPPWLPSIRDEADYDRRFWTDRYDDDTEPDDD